MEGERRVAALDLGTNNCRLLVARCAGRGVFVPLRGFQLIVRLGEGLGVGGRLQPQAVARTLEALRVCARICAEEGVAAFRGILTAVGRLARDVDDFLRLAEAETGLRLEVVDEAEEARLSLLACLPLVDLRAPRSVILDVGGGSSEVIVPHREGPTVAASLPLGAVNATETFGDATDPAVYARIRAATLAELRARGFGALPPEPRAVLIGTSGTATVLAALTLGLHELSREAVDGARMDMEAVRATIRSVLAMSLDARRQHPVIGPGRADVLPAGAAILEAVAEHLGCGTFVAADRGPLDGLVRRLCGAALPPVAFRGASHGTDRDEMAKTVKKSAGRGRLSASSRRWLERQARDPFVRRAKAEGYRARSVYKLEEMDRRFGLLRPGMRVLDIGAAPGSWSQYAARRGCRVVAVDLLEIEPISGVEIVRGDVRDPAVQAELRARLGGPAQVVLSDLAPNTSGDKVSDRLRSEAACEEILAFVPEVLAAGGSLVLKLLRGAEAVVVPQARALFGKVRHVRPQATRAESSEIYLVCTDFRPPPSSVAAGGGSTGDSRASSPETTSSTGSGSRGASSSAASASRTEP
ncbi:Ribosomal RNA large subunit methyltransferase E [bacterium HR39]|nr:Ribosomal RNA large subunit methyltransferase E [bacterium HR39]